MNGYSTHWAATIFAAIIFHFVAAAGFSYVLPKLAPEKNFEDVVEIELVDEKIFQPEVVAQEAIPSTDAQEVLPTFNAQDLFVPDLKIPEPKIEPPVPSATPAAGVRIQDSGKRDNSTNQNPKPQPLTTNHSPKASAPEDNRQRLVRPPITIMEVYPEEGSVLGFKGYISFAARIGKDGKVKSTEILQSSGRYFVDEIARKAAVQWAFKPALDQSGRPMECDKIITFDFKNRK